jgi:hypothetical protein
VVATTSAGAPATTSAGTQAACRPRGGGGRGGRASRRMLARR